MAMAEPEGACCHEFGGNGMICEQLTEHVCTDYQGYWFGDGVNCNDPQVDCHNPPLTGACCYEDPHHGLVCAELIQEFCIDANGYWYGPGVSCSDAQVECNPLNAEGACCYKDADNNPVCDQLIEEHCLDANGAWYGPGVDCTDPQVDCGTPSYETGACCYDDATFGFICWELTQDNCQSMGGYWYGPGVSCNEPFVECELPPSPEGACCYEDPDQGVICAQLIQEHCLDVNGVWYGIGVDCNDPQVDCGGSSSDKGACCYADADGTLNCIEINVADCENLSGTWYGVAVLCSDPVVECDNSSNEIGACCYEDATLGFICAMLTSDQCLSLPSGYWYGAGVVCGDPQVECDLPVGGDCIIEPGANCAGRPAYQDPAFSQVFGNGEVAIQTASPSIFGGSVVTVFDLSGANSAPVNSWFALNRYSDSDWNQNTLGSVYGLAVDGEGNIFVTTTRSWFSDYVGIGGWGAIYRLDAITGDVTIFADLPNLGTGLGSITYDCDHDVFFVSNMEDGLIYRLDSNGNVLDTFDPALPWTGAAGPVALGDRPWAVEVHAGRLYFSMWNEHYNNAVPGAANEIWSVQLDASGMPVGLETLEVSIPSYSASVEWSAPVGDIRFSPRGTMLLAERGMMNFTQLGAHQARVLEYVCEAGSWVASASTFEIGEIAGSNSSGGVDADMTRTWASGDALHVNHPAPYQNIYGFQGLPSTGGDVTNSLLIDYQDNMIGQDKTMIGDLVVTHAEAGPCLNTNFFDVNCKFHHHNGVYHKVEFGFSAMGSGTIAEVQVSGPGVNINPNPIVGPFPPYQSYPVDVRMYGATGGQSMCLTLTAIFTDGSICVGEICFEVPVCSEPGPGDTNYDFKVDVTDLLSIIEAWGNQCGEDDDCTADQDGDDVIGIGDLLIVLENWTSR